MSSLNNRFTKSDIAYIKEVVGEIGTGTTRINHIGCPAGEDRHRRLYVTFGVDGNSAKAYCHNCGFGGGWYTSGPRNIYMRAERNVVESTPFDGAVAPLSPEHRAYLSAYGINTRWQDDFFFTHKTTGRLGSYIVADFITGDPKERKKYGVNLKDLHGCSPKYLRYYYNKHVDSSTYASDGTLNKVVIVEDQISALKIAQAGYTSVAVLCCHAHIMQRTVDIYSKHQWDIAVWMDNDVNAAKEAVENVVRSSANCGIKLGVIRDLRDPKYYTEQRIKERIALAFAERDGVCVPLEAANAAGKLCQVP